MRKEVLKEPIFAKEIAEIIKVSPSIEEMREQLRDYHENDIAQSFEFLNRAERNLLYSALDAKWMAEIIAYIDNPSEYIEEIGIDKLAEIINEMDADDAVDLWEDIDESVKVKLRPMIDDETKTDIRLINSYDEDEIGSLMSNYNRMVARTNELIQIVYKNKIKEQEMLVERQNAELLALHSQINPHFLLNVLNLIQWMAQMSHQKDIGEYTSALKKLLSYNLGKEGKRRSEKRSRW